MLQAKRFHISTNYVGRPRQFNRATVWTKLCNSPRCTTTSMCLRVPNEAQSEICLVSSVTSMCPRVVESACSLRSDQPFAQACTRRSFVVLFHVDLGYSAGPSGILPAAQCFSSAERLPCGCRGVPGSGGHGRAWRTIHRSLLVSTSAQGTQVFFTIISVAAKCRGTLEIPGP